MKQPVRLLHALLIACILAGCGAASSAPAVGTPGAACLPTDQDQYVYEPARLKVLQACVHVSGIVEEVDQEPDGDLTILLRLDPPYQGLLNEANRRDQGGDLVVEPVCVVQPLEPDPIAVCAADADPYADPFPAVGAHVWMEGRYVLDANHTGWAELHPLYRSGLMPS